LAKIRGLACLFVKNQPEIDAKDLIDELSDLSGGLFGVRSPKLTKGEFQSLKTRDFVAKT
jgi:hypothetical protein